MDLPSLFILVLGAAVGSFLNVCIHRLPREESIVSPPSHCPGCGAPIRPSDNIPIASFLLLRGRCRSCGAPIRRRYIAVEAITAAAFLLLWRLHGGSPPMFVIAAAFSCGLIVVFFVDIEHQIIPDEISLGGIPFGLLASVAHPALQAADTRTAALLSSAAGAALGGGIFWLIRVAGGRIFRKEAMGLGDVKLMTALGALLGPSLVLFTTFSAAVIGSVVGLSLIAVGKADLGSRLPFGPFICAGAALAFFWGRACIGWYVGLLG
ncbi:MAG: prepilin peptidase [bacterium]|nr:prepilin peptidase [bacterium]